MREKKFFFLKREKENWGENEAVYFIEVLTLSVETGRDLKSAIEITCKNRFRDLTDISQYLIRYFQLMSGEFYPRQYSIGKAFNLGQYNEDIFKDIEQNKYKLVCFNDSSQIDDFEKAKNELIDFFEKKYYEKSEYEI